MSALATKMIQVTPELSVAETQALTAARQTADTSEEIKATDHVYIEKNGFLIGEHTYLIYTKEQATYGYGFLIRTDDGYSYQFHYILPYDTIQDEIPVEAISILSTLEIQESSEYTD